MSYLSNKKNCLFTKKISEELKKLLALEKGKVEKLDQKFAKKRRLLIVSRAQLVLFKVNMMSY
jgi:hypothetical protein